jgi:hypothetical protein
VRVAAVLLQPPSLRLHLSAPLPLRTLARSTSRLRHLSLANDSAAGSLRFLLHEGLQLPALSSLTAAMPASEREHSDRAVDILLAAVAAAPALQQLRIASAWPSSLEPLGWALPLCTGPTGLDLSRVKVWPEADVSALAGVLPEMRRLRVLCLPQIHGSLRRLAPHHLAPLHYLTAQLGALPALSKLSLSWFPGHRFGAGLSCRALALPTALRDLAVSSHVPVDAALEHTLPLLAHLTRLALQGHPERVAEKCVDSCSSPSPRARNCLVPPAPQPSATQLQARLRRQRPLHSKCDAPCRPRVPDDP